VSVTPFPIVMAAGIARFDVLREYLIKQLALLGLIDPDNAPDSTHYFKGIESHLEAQGFKVFPSDVNFAGGVELRAADLKKSVEHALEVSKQPKAHIIGHSMGGLDARHMIVNLGMDKKVATLTTIGTPHLGSSVAEWLIDGAGHFVTKPLSWFLNIDGLADSTRAACKAFNEANEAAEADNDVRYRTYWSVEDRQLIFFPLHAGWDIITTMEMDEDGGANDGLASGKSQRWQSTLKGSQRTKTIEVVRFPVPADHLNEIGWWDFNELNDGKGFLHPIKRALEFEKRIKDIYLDIARSL
jgi:pimeloyl-ACP methyl ester carboxylesterase